MPRVKRTEQKKKKKNSYLIKPNSTLRHLRASGSKLKVWCFSTHCFPISTRRHCADRLHTRAQIERHEQPHTILLCTEELSIHYAALETPRPLIKVNSPLRSKILRVVVKLVCPTSDPFQIRKIRIISSQIFYSRMSLNSIWIIL